MLKSTPATNENKLKRLDQGTSVSRKRVLFTRENLSSHIKYGNVLIIRIIWEIILYAEVFKLIAVQVKISQL